MKKIYISIIVCVFIFSLVIISSRVAASPEEKIEPMSLTNDTILYVMVGGNGECTSWNDSCDLQIALGKANPGDQVWVAEGTYFPTTTNDPSATFNLESGVAIYGGFQGTELTLSERDWKLHVSTLSCDIGIVGDTTDNCHPVVRGNDVNASAILDGFTIRNGNSPNYAGGGMRNDYSNPTLSNLKFVDNSAHSGGGIFNRNSNPSLSNVIFMENTASYGGGIDNDVASSPTLVNVTFINNSADAYGGGMINSAGSNPTLSNVTFYGNSAAWSGGGIANTYGCIPIVNNSILWANTPDQISDFEPNIIITYSAIQGGYAGEGNIETDPLLGPLADNGGFMLSMALGTGSPAIDTGDPNYCPAIDQRSYLRPIDGNEDGTARCDMGAYEYGSIDAGLSLDLSISIIGNGWVSKDPYQSLYYPGQIVTLSAYPELGWSFWEWSGDASGTDNPLVLPVTSDLSITANFEEDLFLSCATIADVPPQECEALVALYNSTNGAMWADNSNWMVTTTVENWFGVTVANGHVTRVDLTSNGLSGSIPNLLSNLGSLNFLSLWDNQLSGIIPPELGSLSNLMELLLAYNDLTGIIPPELGNLHNLISIWLSGNQLTGVIPPSLGNLSSLGYLGLNSNQLSGSIPSELGSLSSLFFLYLSNNQLSGSIPVSFNNLTMLDYFHFYETYLCEPDDPDFLAWKATVLDWQGTGVTCQTPGAYNIYLPLIKNGSPCSKAPILLEPANGSNLDNLIPIFSFDTGNDPNVTGFVMSVARDVDFNQSVTSLSISGSVSGIYNFRFSQNFDPSTTLYWRAYNRCGEIQSPYSQTWSFTTGSGGPIMPAPTLISPPDDSVLPTLPVNLEWSAVNGAWEYLVHWRRTGLGGYSYTYTADTNFTIWGLNPNTTYEWWITARNDYAWGLESEKWQFTTPAETLSITQENLNPIFVTDEDGTTSLIRD